MAGWTTLQELVRDELIQSGEEGKDPKAIQSLGKEAASAGGDKKRLAAIHDELLALPIRPDFPFQEPNELGEIRRLRKGSSVEQCSDDARLDDQMHGAWLGRCVGCALGKPIEAFMSARNEMASWERTKKFLTAISPDEWPVRDYIPHHSPAEEETGSLWCAPSTRDHIAFMESDDDIRYTVLGQVLLKEKGAGFTSGDVADGWMRRLPYRFVCTAEMQAYRNLVAIHVHHIPWAEQPIDWAWVATHQNPYREWIGAQIRIDSYAYAAPGRPALAAEFAWRDARISHVKNGIYGAMFCAAMIAAAFTASDVRQVIEAGLAEIPATSRLYSEMREVIAICEKHRPGFDSFEPAIEAVYAKLAHYHAVHTNNNAGVCVMALLLSGGNYDLGIRLAVMGGFDSDCNGATVGSILGAMTGAKRLPEHWTGRLHDTLRSEVVGYDPIAISECGRRAAEIARGISLSAPAIPADRDSPKSVRR